MITVAKLSNGLDLTNTNLTEAMCEYLIQCGFKMSIRKDETQFFRNDPERTLTLQIKLDCLWFYTCSPGSVGYSHNSEFKGGYVGINNLSLEQWILQLHLMGVVDMSDYVSYGYNINEQTGLSNYFVIKKIKKLVDGEALYIGRKS